MRGLGPESLCTNNSPIRFSRLQIFALSLDGHFGLGHNGSGLFHCNQL